MIKVFLDRYDITGGRQNLGPPPGFDEAKLLQFDRARLSDKLTYRNRPGKADKHFESILFSEWNAGTPRPAYADDLAGLDGVVYALVKDGNVLYNLVDGVFYEEAPPLPDGTIHYVVKVDALNRKFSHGEAVFNGTVNATPKFSATWRNQSRGWLTAAVVITDCTNCDAGLEVGMFRGDSPIRAQNKLTVIGTLKNGGSFYYDSREHRGEYATLAFRANTPGEYNVVAAIGAY